MIEASSRSWVQIKALEAVAERLPSQLRGTVEAGADPQGAPLGAPLRGGEGVISRYSAKRGVYRRFQAPRGGQFCVWDNQTGRRVSRWMGLLDASLEASKRNDQLRSTCTPAATGIT